MRQMLKVILIIVGILLGLLLICYLLFAAVCLKMRYEDELLD